MKLTNSTINYQANLKKKNLSQIEVKYLLQKEEKLEEKIDYNYVENDLDKIILESEFYQMLMEVL